MTSQARTPIQMALTRKLQQELQTNEQVTWFAYPDTTRRAKQAPARALFSSWLGLRILLLIFTLAVFFLSNSIYQADAFLSLHYGAIILLALMVGSALVLLRRRTAQQRLQHTLYAITTQRLLVITLDRDQVVQNSYYPSDLGRIDLIERNDSWGDIVIGGQQRVQSRGFSLAVVAPRLSGVAKAREVALLLTRLKAEQRVAVSQ
jgi:hypothetical protein